VSAQIERKMSYFNYYSPDIASDDEEVDEAKGKPWF